MNVSNAFGGVFFSDRCPSIIYCVRLNISGNMDGRVSMLSVNLVTAKPAAEVPSFCSENSSFTIIKILHA
jgi:hypothetical protein